MPISLLQHIIRLGNVFPSEIRRIRPSKEVETFIEGFYVLPCTDGQADVLAFNDCTPMMVFMPHLESIVEVQTKEECRLITSAWLSLPSSVSTYLRFSPDVEWLLVVRFRAECFYRTSELSAKELSAQPFRALAQLMGNEFLSELYRTADIQKKIQRIEEAVKDRISGGRHSCKLIEEAANYIRHRKGNTSIAEVTRQLNVNYKWLERNFSNYIGMTPKSYGCSLRFIHAYADLTRTHQHDLIGIATNNGYYDQSHFIREFKQFTGKTPLQFLESIR